MKHASLLLLVVVAAIGCPNNVNVDGECVDVGGDWTQSWVCFDEVSGFCERDDADTFSITQASCTDLDSDVVGTFDATRTDADDGTVSVEWTATSGGYTEAGSWDFSDADNFTSASDFEFSDGSGNGPCVAVGRRGAAPAPVACGSICNAAQNRDDICPNG